MDSRSGSLDTERRHKQISFAPLVTKCVSASLHGKSPRSIYMVDKLLFVL